MARRMFSLPLMVGVWLLLAGAAPAALHPDHVTLLNLLERIQQEKSGADSTETIVDQAITAANSLASHSCSAGYKVAHIHGVLISIRLLLRVGNVALHRHGNKDKATEALLEARQILLDNAATCMSGNESAAALAAFNETVNAASNLTDGVPAANPDIYPPPEGAPTGPNHCSEESPDLDQVYAKAKVWLNTQISYTPGAQPGGSVLCVPTDPDKVWRAEVLSKDGASWMPAELVYVNIDTWECHQ